MKNGIKIAIVLIFAISVAVILLNKQSKNGNEDSTKVTVTKGSDTSTAVPKLIDLGSHNCVPCRMMMPVLDTLKDMYAGNLAVQFIDVWENREAGQKYGIRVIPTQIFYDKNGVEKFRHEGFWSRKEIEQKFAELNIVIGE